MLISLTLEGKRALSTKLREYEGVREQIAAALGVEERRVAADLLRRLAEVMEEV